MSPLSVYAHQHVKQGAARPSTPLIAALLLLSHVTHCKLGRDLTKVLFNQGNYKEMLSILADHEPKCGVRGGGVLRSQSMSTAVHMEPKKTLEI
jgi:hypothetical protein